MEATSMQKDLMPPCSKKENGEFCRNFQGMFPLCEGHDLGPFTPPGFGWRQDLEERSLVQQIFEAKDILLKKKEVRLRTAGSCMYPIMKDGDTLHLALKKVKDIQVGEIPVCRRDNRFFGHRTVRKAFMDGKDVIYTKPDTAVHEDPSPIFDEDILGVVLKIERGGKFFSPASRKSNFIEKAVLYLRNFQGRIFSNFHKAVFFLQRRRIYSLLMRPVILGREQDKRFSIYAPANSNINGRFYSEIGEDDFLKNIHGAGAGVALKFKISVKKKQAVLASLLLVKRPEGCPSKGWWASWFCMRARYRGIGLEQELIRAAFDLLRRIGARCIATSVPCGDLAGRRILESLHFKESGKTFQPKPQALIVLESQINP